MKIFAIIPAAGIGSRMNIGRNKQFADIAGIPMLARTLMAFNKCTSINAIVISAKQDDISYIDKNIVSQYGFNKVLAVIPGGSIRQDSVYNALLEIEANSCLSAGPDDIVLIHDGARPLIAQSTILECINAVEIFGAACTAVPVNNTIKTSDPEGFISRTLDRNMLWSIQTPQAFRFALIIDSYRKALADGFYGTDDSILVERNAGKVKLVMGTYDNLKITTPEDLFIAESMIAHSAVTTAKT